MNSSVNDWQQIILSSLEEIGFKSSHYSDADIGIRPAVKPDTGFEYYEIFFIFVDYILCIRHSPSGPIDQLGKLYALNKVTLKETDRYLGANIYNNYFKYW